MKIEKDRVVHFHYTLFEGRLPEGEASGQDQEPVETSKDREPVAMQAYFDAIAEAVAQRGALRGDDPAFMRDDLAERADGFDGPEGVVLCRALVRGGYDVVLPRLVHLTQGLHDGIVVLRAGRRRQQQQGDGKKSKQSHRFLGSRVHIAADGAPPRDRFT